MGWLKDFFVGSGHLGPTPPLRTNYFLEPDVIKLHVEFYVRGDGFREGEIVVPKMLENMAQGERRLYILGHLAKQFNIDGWELSPSDIAKADMGRMTGGPIEIIRCRRV